MSGACLASDNRNRLVIDLARTSTDTDERADFFEHEVGCRETGVAIRTNWAEIRIAQGAWRRFATAAKRVPSKFRVHGGQAQASVPSNGASHLFLPLHCSRRKSDSISEIRAHEATGDDLRPQRRQLGC
jgi:hypothetical protein